MKSGRRIVVEVLVQKTGVRLNLRANDPLEAALADQVRGPVGRVFARQWDNVGGLHDLLAELAKEPDVEKEIKGIAQATKAAEARRATNTRAQKGRRRSDKAVA